MIRVILLDCIAVAFRGAASLSLHNSSCISLLITDAMFHSWKSLLYHCHKCCASSVLISLPRRGLARCAPLQSLHDVFLGRSCPIFLLSDSDFFVFPIFFRFFLSFRIRFFVFPIFFLSPSFSTESPLEERRTRQQQETKP